MTLPDAPQPTYPPYGYGYPPPPSPPRRTHSTTVLVVVGLVAGFVGLLVGGTAVGAFWAASNSSKADTVELAEDRLPEEMDRLTSFIEEARGLEFKYEVRVQFLDGAAFEEALLGPEGTAAEPDTATADYASTFMALGLTENADDYYAAETADAAAGIVGFYDPYGDRLVVRGEEWTPMVEATVVHELVHALQDQHYDLVKLDESTEPDDDSWMALHTVVEGDASWIESAYIDSMRLDWRREYDAAWDSVDYGNGPYDPLAGTLSSIPYSLGWTAAEAFDAAGADAWDRALREPPTTVEQVSDVQAWLDDAATAAAAVEVPAPAVPDGAAVLDHGSLGVGMLSLLPMDLEESYYDGSEGLTGWRGDSYVTWRAGDQVCAAVDVRLDDAAAVRSASDYLAPWATAHGGTVTPGEAALRLESCA